MGPSEHGVHHLTRVQAWSLYALHFLFTWNLRTYEYAAIIFTASTYPDTLTAASIRGVSTTAAAICFSTPLGRWIDRSPSRLRSLAASINAHRCATIGAYIVWLFIVDDSKAGAKPHDNSAVVPHLGGFVRNGLFAVIVAFDILEKLSGVANTISTNREWLPVLAPSSASTSAQTALYDLTHLNAVLERIDLVSKLLTPFLITAFISFNESYRLCIVVVTTLSALSWMVELLFARRIYASSPSLRAPKALTKDQSAASQKSTSTTLLQRFWRSLTLLTVDQARSLRQYFATSVWVPSLSYTLLHMTILTYSSSFITYMLDIGFSLNLITIARASGSIVEVGSTVLTPWAIHFFSLQRSARRRQLPSPSSFPPSSISTTASANEEDNDEAERFLPHPSDATHPYPLKDTSVLERVGLAGISWQFLSLVPVVLILFFLPSPTSSSFSNSSQPQKLPLPPTLILFCFLSLSRLGMWAYHLTTTELTQTLVPAPQLAAFGGAQESFQSCFELAHWLATAVWGDPRHFRWLALGSLGAVGTSASAYSVWTIRGSGKRSSGVEREDIELRLEVDDDGDDHESNDEAG